jgi:carboxypeptidase C (cathepsin A)
VGFCAPLRRNSFESLTILGGGKQGFQQAPKPDSFIIEGFGAMGTVQNERKFGYYEVVLSGHMVPQFAPQVGFLKLSPPPSPFWADCDLLC